MDTCKVDERIPKPRWVLRTYEYRTDGSLGRPIRVVTTPSIRRDKEGVVSFKFTCKCCKQTCYMAAGHTSPPCPECGRVYVGVEEENEYGTNLRAREVVKEE